MTLGALLALCKSFSMQKSTVLCAIAAKRVKKQQTEKKIKKILVQKIGIPILRFPLSESTLNFRIFLFNRTGCLCEVIHIRRVDGGAL